MRSGVKAVNKKKSNKNLPDEYVPKSLQEPEPVSREVAYGIGVGKKWFRKNNKMIPISFGMTHGPYPTLEETLDVVPDDEYRCQEKTFVIRFNKDGTDDVLYQWDANRDRWVRFKSGDQ